MHIYLTPSPSPDDNFIDFWTPEFFPLIVEYLRRPSIAAHRLKGLKAGVPDPSRKATKGQEFGARVIEKIILNLSDQLLLIGSAVLIAGFWTHCSISVYHFALVSDLAWFASTCHLTTVAALEKYLRRRPMFRDWRVFLMACMAILLAASTVMQGHRAWYSSSHSTWLHKESGIHWPSDFLCRDINNARTFTFGYDATVFKFGHQVSRHHIKDHAEKLLNHLTIERESTGTVRPIFLY